MEPPKFATYYTLLYTFGFVCSRSRLCLDLFDPLLSQWPNRFQFSWSYLWHCFLQFLGRGDQKRTLLWYPESWWCCPHFERIWCFTCWLRVILVVGFGFALEFSPTQIPFYLLHYNSILQSVVWRHICSGFSLHLLWLILLFIYDCWIVLHMLLLFFGVLVVNVSGWACWFGSGSKFSNVSALSSIMTFVTIFGSVFWLM